MARFLVRLSIIASLLRAIACQHEIKIHQGDSTPTAAEEAAQRVKGTLKLKRPNVLIIMADDVGTGDIPAYWGTNSSQVKMPNIDNLASKGVRFTDAHSTPLCAPSRYVLLSGNYQHRGTAPAGTWKVGSHNQFVKGQQSLAQVLRDGGNYHTAMFGKWHLGGIVPPHGIIPGARNDEILKHKGHDWTLPLGQGPQDIGFDTSFMTTGGIQAPPYVFLRDGYVATNVSDIIDWKSGWYPMSEGISKIGKGGEGAPDWDSTAYNMILVNETAKFLDKHQEKRTNDPFFAYVALGSVHVPHSPPYTYLDGTPVAGKYETAHMDVLGEMDKVVGSLVDSLKERNLLEDTIIIFTSDNGGLTFSMDYNQMSSGPLREAKGSIYEGGHRVPFIMRWDGKFPAGTTRKHVVGLNDVFATVCELASVNVPKRQAQDSISFANYIWKPRFKNSLRQYLGTWRYNSQGFAAAIRKDNFKLVQKYPSQDIELYDLDVDISETNDISSDPAHEELISDMLSELASIGPPGSCMIRSKSSTVFRIDSLDTWTCCDWASKQAEKRCSEHKEVRENCPSVCTKASPAAPSLSCRGQPLFEIKGMQRRKCCNWVKQGNTRSICNKFSEVRENCPSECDGISSIVEPIASCKGEKTFQIQGQDTAKCCKWVRRHRAKFRCKSFPEARENCPRVCNRHIVER